VPDQTNEPITEVLSRLVNGDAQAAEVLYPRVYAELRAIAGRWFRGGGRDSTLQPTALVHEAYIHLIDETQAGWQSRSHFFGVAASAMRQILIQHARRRSAKKRGSDWSRVTLSAAAIEEQGLLDLLDLDDALHALERVHQRQAKVVELRFFGDLTVEETAQVLGVSERTVKADYRMARAFLSDKLESNQNR